MFCCSNCFADAEIKAIIDGNKTIGDCEFCGSKSVHLYEIGKDQTIAELLDDLLDVYTPISDLPADFPHEKTDLLKNVLCSNLRIFNLRPDVAYKLITAICTDRYKEQPNLFDSPVGIKQGQDRDYVKGIKRKNRFHSDYINTDKLFIFLRCAVEPHRKGEVMFRSRICPNEKGFTKAEMGPPPDNKAKGGRVNPAGISILYLADSIETTLYEIRAGVYDFVSVGRFELLRDSKLSTLQILTALAHLLGLIMDLTLHSML